MSYNHDNDHMWGFQWNVYASWIGNGKSYEINSNATKRHGLDCVMGSISCTDETELANMLTSSEEHHQPMPIHGIRIHSDHGCNSLGIPFKSYKFNWNSGSILWTQIRCVWSWKIKDLKVANTKKERKREQKIQEFCAPSAYFGFGT